MIAAGLICLAVYAVGAAWVSVYVFRSLRDWHVERYGAATVNDRPVRVAHLRLALKGSLSWPLVGVELLRDGLAAVALVLSEILKRWAGHD